MTDIFFQPEYGKLYDQIEHGTCEFFDFASDTGTIKHMYIKKPIPWLINGVQYSDVITPYGYGGPVVTEGNATSEFLSDYYNAWTKHCIQNGIVAEFMRFHLFDNTELRLAFPGEVLKISDNVVRRLDIDMNDMWMEFDHKVRKNVKKAQNSGLVVNCDSNGERLNDFLNIYYSTMERNNAKDYYYFDKSYFQKIIKTLSGHFMFFHVWNKEKIISTELVLCSEKYVYSFLGGTLEEYYPLRPNDLLKFEIIKWSKETARKAFLLGGGYGGNDGIYRYKKSFAPGEDIPYFIGKRIIQTDVYDKLVELRRIQDPSFDMDSKYFPLYRS